MTPCHASPGTSCMAGLARISTLIQCFDADTGCSLRHSEEGYRCQRVLFPLQSSNLPQTSKYSLARLSPLFHQHGAAVTLTMLLVNQTFGEEMFAYVVKMLQVDPVDPPFWS